MKVKKISKKRTNYRFTVAETKWILNCKKACEGRRLKDGELNEILKTFNRTFKKRMKKIRFAAKWAKTVVSKSSKIRPAKKNLLPPVPDKPKENTLFDRLTEIQKDMVKSILPQLCTLIKHCGGDVYDDLAAMLCPSGKSKELIDAVTNQEGPIRTSQFIEAMARQFVKDAANNPQGIKVGDTVSTSDGSGYCPGARSYTVLKIGKGVVEVQIKGHTDNEQIHVVPISKCIVLR